MIECIGRVNMAEALVESRDERASSLGEQGILTRGLQASEYWHACERHTNNTLDGVCSRILSEASSYWNV
jgi:hypothetical protein